MRLITLLSLRSLAAIGFACAALPLGAAFLYAVLAAREAVDLGKGMNQKIFEQTKAIGIILQKTADIERKARLFVLLAEPAVRHPYERESYESMRASFKQTVAGLLLSQVDNALALLANELSEKESLIYQQIIEADEGGNLKLPVDEAFKNLREASNALAHEFDAYRERQFADIEQGNASLENRLLAIGAALALVSALMIAFVWVLLGRALKPLDAALRQLEAGDFAEAIEIDGPSDIRLLGGRLEALRMRLSGPDAAQPQAVEAPPEGAADSEAGQEEKQTLNVKTLLEAAIEAQQTRLQAKSIALIALASPVELCCVPAQLRAIFDHLLAHAIFCSPEGGEIRVMLRASGGLMELEIEDEQQDAEPSARAQAFSPLFRGKRGPEGMALTAVSNYITQHQGQLDIIEPRMGQQGVCIRVQIPLNGEKT
jgi:two-component system sensor histidine kinase GlrK